LEELYIIDVETAELIAASTLVANIRNYKTSKDKMLKIATEKNAQTIAIIGSPLDHEPYLEDSLAISVCERSIASILVTQKNRARYSVKVVSRFKLDRVLQELSFQLKDLVDANKRKRLGLFTGASSIFVVTPSKNKKEINLQLMDLESAEVFAASDIKYDVINNLTYRNSMANMKY